MITVHAQETAIIVRLSDLRDHRFLLKKVGNAHFTIHRRYKENAVL